MGDQKLHHLHLSKFHLIRGRFHFNRGLGKWWEVDTKKPSKSRHWFFLPWVARVCHPLIPQITIEWTSPIFQTDLSLWLLEVAMGTNFICQTCWNSKHFQPFQVIQTLSLHQSQHIILIQGVLRAQEVKRFALGQHESTGWNRTTGT